MCAPSQLMCAGSPLPSQLMCAETGRLLCVRPFIIVRRYSYVPRLMPYLIVADLPADQQQPKRGVQRSLRSPLCPFLPT